jgi:hypothetical protein
MAKLKRKLTVEQMIGLHDKGHTLEEIGKKAGVTRERARQVLAEAGVRRTIGEATRMFGHKRRVPVDRRAVQRAAKHCKSFGQIAHEVGVAEPTVYARCCEWGIRPQPPVPLKVVQQILALGRAGETSAEIARRVGRYQSSVHRILVRHGVIKPKKVIRRWQKRPVGIAA